MDSRYVTAPEVNTTHTGARARRAPFAGTVAPRRNRRVVAGRSACSIPSDADGDSRRGQANQVAAELEAHAEEGACAARSYDAAGLQEAKRSEGLSAYDSFDLTQTATPPPKYSCPRRARQTRHLNASSVSQRLGNGNRSKSRRWTIGRIPHGPLQRLTRTESNPIRGVFSRSVRVPWMR